MKRVGLKLSCLLLSLVLWLQVAATTTVDGTVTMPLEVAGLRPGTGIVRADLPGTVRVRVRGSRLLLLAHRYFGRHCGDVVVEVGAPVPGIVVERDVDESDVRSDFTALAIAPPVHLHLRTVSVAGGGGEARR
jgi:hypothetical protein